MGKSLIAKGKGELAGVGDELPENAPRRRQLLFCLACVPFLTAAVGSLGSPHSLAMAMWLGYSMVLVVPLAVVFVGSYFSTLVADVLLSLADQVLWPALRWLGRNLAESFHDGRRISPFLRDEDPIVESRAIQAFIPDEQWVPTVGALVGVHTAFFSWSLLVVAGLPPGSFASGVQLLAVWSLILCLVALLALRTVAGRYRTVIGLVWMAQESLAWLRRVGRRGYYLTQPTLQLEEGVAAEEVACPYCAAPLGEAPRVACETCQTPHHADCWQAFGRCTVYACTGELARRMG
jgi:hypothetical protein